MYANFYFAKFQNVGICMINLEYHFEENFAQIYLPAWSFYLSWTANKWNMSDQAIYYLFNHWLNF